jgi:hypothetical protein
MPWHILIKSVGTKFSRRLKILSKKLASGGKAYLVDGLWVDFGGIHLDLQPLVWLVVDLLVQRLPFTFFTIFFFFLSFFSRFDRSTSRFFSLSLRSDDQETKACSIPFFPKFAFF